MMIKLIFRCITILIIVTSGGLYAIVFGAVLFNLVITVLTLMLFVLKLQYPKDDLKKFLRFLSLLLTVLTAHFIFTGSNNQDNEFLKLLIRVVSICLLLLVYDLYRRSLADDLLWVLNILAIHSLLNFIFGFLMPDLLIRVDSDQVLVETIRYLFFYHSEANLFNVRFFRNQGIFWEPGVLSVYLNIGLYIYIYIRNSNKMILLYLFLIISTFSSTGLVVAMFQVLFYYKNLILKNLKILFGGLLLSLLLIPIVIENVTEKLMGEGKASFTLRSYDFLVSVKIMFSNFFVGIGFGEEVYRVEQLKYSIFGDLELDDGRGNTNSIMYLFVAFGVPLGLLVLRNLYKQAVVDTTNKLSFFVVIMFCLSSEPLITSGMFLLFIFSNSLYRNHPSINTQIS